MNEEKLNISIRKFLKNVGISSQRNIEEHVREKVKSRLINNSKKITIEAKITSKELGLEKTIDGEIEIEI